MPSQRMQQQQPNAGSGPSVVHAQFNTPVGMYSDKNVNDSFQQQASVMKNEFGKYVNLLHLILSYLLYYVEMITPKNCCLFSNYTRF